MNKITPKVSTAMIRKTFKYSHYSLWLVLPLLAVSINYTAKAQNNNVVYVPGIYEPIISDAFKINQNPKIIDTTIIIPTMKYSISSRKINTPFQIEPIKPAKIVDEKIIELYKNLIKFGFGNYLTPYGEFFSNTLRSRKYAIGAHIKHISSNNTLKDYAFSGYSENEASLYAKRFTKNHVFSGDVDFKRDVIHYYGYNPDNYVPVLTHDDIKQRFSFFSAQTGLNSIYTDSTKLQHSARLKYYNFSDFYNTSENNIYFNGVICKNFKLFDSIKTQTLGLNALVNYYNDKNLLTTTNNSVVKLEPYISTNYNILKFYLGLKTLTQVDSNPTIHAKLNTNVTINIVKDVLLLYAGITGDLNKINFKTLCDENPFINTTTIPLGYTYNKFKFFAGINGCFSTHITYNISISTSEIENMPFFITDTTNTMRNKFTIVYDNVELFQAKGEISYQKDEKLKFILRSNLYQYVMTVENKSWYKPDYDASLSINYTLKDKIILTGDVIALGKMYANTYAKSPEEIDGIIDVNLGIEYRYSKILSAFINFNNIGGVRYYKWYNYPMQRFNMLAGITYAF